MLEKWLKDRKKRVLNLEEIQHYCRVAAVTIRIQEEIDRIYPDIEVETIDIALSK